MDLLQASLMLKTGVGAVAFSLSLGISLFSGITPVFLVYLISQTQILMWPAAWLIFGASIAGVSVLASRKTQRDVVLGTESADFAYAS